MQLAPASPVAAAHVPDAGPDVTFEAVVFDWDGTAVPDRQADARAARQLVERLCAAGVHVAVVSGTHVGNVDGQLRARPDGPGTLHLCLNRGSEVFVVTRDGPRLVWERTATSDEERALDRAAALTVGRLARAGLEATVVSQRRNRRKIDLIPLPAWQDPPKARIAVLLEAVLTRLAAAGFPSLTPVLDLARAAAADAGLRDARVTTDAKHVEIGLTDKANSMEWCLTRFRQLGIGPGLVLIGGDEFGPLGDAPGSDSLMLVPEAARCTAVSVGAEPGGVPPGARRLGGGPARFLALLEAQLERRTAHRVPAVDRDPEWTLTIPTAGPCRRVGESAGCLASGRIGVRATPDPGADGARPGVLVAGVYTDAGNVHLQPAPAPGTLLGGVDGPAILDLATGVVAVEGRRRWFQFVAEDDTLVTRAEAPTGSPPADAWWHATAAPLSSEGEDDEVQWATSRADHGPVIAAAAVSCRNEGLSRTCAERVVSYAVGADESAAVRDAAARVRGRSSVGFDRLLASHREAWAHRWSGAAISIEGDPEAQLRTRFAIFHLLASASLTGEAAVAPRGLTGPAYGGHVLWDSEVFVLPALAAIAPEAARAMLEYRLRSLGAARAMARAGGRLGARFPWESAADGSDVTPRSGIMPDGRHVAILTGEYEEHITSDVAWAAELYGQWTGDDGLLTGAGAPLILETARYWASRIERDGGGAAHIRDVIGPDEYHERVDDNAFTNVMARWHLRRAAGLADRAGGVPVDERRRWLALADALVDGYDPVTGVYEQFRGFRALEPLLITDVAQPPVAADVLLGPGRVSGAQVVKQPDVLMLHHMVPDEMEVESLAPNLAFYEPRTAQGSSLGPAVHASLLARAGRPDDALVPFRVAAAMDLEDLTGTTAAGLHLATMGGLWQAVVSGFGGVQVSEGVLRVDPHLPESWPSITIRCRFRGAPVEMHLWPGRAEIACREPVTVGIGTQPAERLLPPGGTLHDERSAR